MGMSPLPAIDKKAISLSFGRAAPAYDRHASLQRQVADGLLAALPVSDALDSILDLGSGTGYCARHLAARFPAAQVVGLDISGPMLRVSREKHAGVPILHVCGDAEALPLAGQSVDLLVSSLAIQWCGNLDALFREIRRVLRPGGSARLSTFGPQTLRELRAAWARVDGHVHVNDFQDARRLQAAALRQGFDRLSLREENRTVHYLDLQALARELKAIGARNLNAGQPRGLTGRGRLEALRRHFQQGLVPALGVPVTWQVFYIDLVV